MYFILILVLAAVDRGSKYLVSHTMEEQQSLPVIDHLFYITYVKNDGAAFSMLSGSRILLLSVSVLLTGAAFVYLLKMRKKEKRTVLLALSLIAGGGLGNLIDRAYYGAVVDFFDVPFFAVFNLADVFVCVGCGLLLLHLLFLGKIKENEDTGEETP